MRALFTTFRRNSCFSVRQVIKMLLAVIGIFLLCWGPKLILNIMKRHHLGILHSNSAFAVSVSEPYAYRSRNLKGKHLKFS